MFLKCELLEIKYLWAIFNQISKMPENIQKRKKR